MLEIFLSAEALGEAAAQAVAERLDEALLAVEIRVGK